MSAFLLVPSAAVALVAWLSSPPASLGDVARREALRRQAVPKATTLLTNLGRPVDAEPPSSVSLPPPTPPDVEPPPATAAAAEPPAGEKRDEKWWRDQVALARDTINNGVATQAALQTRINQLQSDVVNLDDPLQRARAQNDLTAALAELKAASEKTEQDRRALASLQEEARRLNVPPGWIR